MNKSLKWCNHTIDKGKMLIKKYAIPASLDNSVFRFFTLQRFSTTYPQIFGKDFFCLESIEV
jgi:hypothetical protein